MKRCLLLLSRKRIILIFFIMATLSFNHLICSECGVDWVAIDQANVLWDVSYGGSDDHQQFVAVGNYGTILTSYNGINWTPRSSGTTRKLVGINYEAYGYYHFIAVGYGGKILYSDSGINWTPISSGTTEKLRSVAFDILFGIHIAVGNNGTIVYGEEESTNWYPIQSPVSGVRLNDVSCEEGYFVVVGNNGTILTSILGDAWTQRSSPTSKTLHSVTYGYDDNDNTIFVAVGRDGTIITSDWRGVNWTPRYSGVNHDLFSVTYSLEKSMFLAVGFSGQKVIALKSTDGITWSNTTIGTKEQLFGVTYGNSRFVAVGDEVSVYSLCD